MDRISVIIVNWNGRAFLSKCLEGLRRQVYQAFYVILVDNGSTDGSVNFVTKNYPVPAGQAQPNDTPGSNDAALHNYRHNFNPSGDLTREKVVNFS